MKKFVAVVLALVMVLGLATTAFAAKLGADDLATAKLDAGWDYTVEVDDEADDKDQTFATYEIEAVAKKDMENADPSWAAEALGNVEKGDDFAVGEVWVKVANPEVAELVMIDGKEITYFVELDELEWTDKAVKVTLPGQPADAGDYKCNTLYNKTGAPGTFYWDAAEEVLYVAADDETDVVLNVGGIAVYAVEAEELVYDEELDEMVGDYYYSAHSLIANWSNRTSGVNAYPTKVYCEFCKADFEFAYGDEEDAIAAFGAGNYVDAAVDTSNFGVPVWVELIAPAIPGVAGTGTGTTVTPVEDGDKVESAETFDAGIAMYVGMSVMAAAGSAVVLKKKD